MLGLFLCRARLVDDAVSDIALKGGRIMALGDVDGPALKTIGLGGECYVSAGWINSHVHCYPKSPIHHDQPDSVGIAAGTTTVVDVGSTGADDIDDFHTLTREAMTEVYALLNISCVGLITQNELVNMANIGVDVVREAVKCHPDFIVGLKTCMSSSVVDENGTTPLGRAKAAQAWNGNLSLMVHIGNNPSNLNGIAGRLSAGDIIIHCYDGKPNRALTPQGELRASVTRAISRGVCLDVGHDTASLSFVVVRYAIGLGILPYTISSDIYCHNCISCPLCISLSPRDEIQN